MSRFMRRKKTRPTTLYIHVGTHKTGTSAIQHFLSRNREQLLAAGVCYPHSGSTPQGGHHLLANVLKGPPFPLLRPEKSLVEYLEDLKSAFQQCPEVLVSSEIFMRFLPSFEQGNRPGLSDLEPLLTVADQVKPIIYFRRQDDYMESFYRQETLHLLKEGPEEFSRERYLNYLSACHELERVFGHGSVIVRCYDEKLFSGGTLLTDFLSIFDINPNPGFEFGTGLQNPSFVAEAIAFRRAINNLGASLHEAMQFNGALAQFSRSNKHRSSDDQWFIDGPHRRQIMDSSLDINKKISEEYLGGGEFIDIDRPAPTGVAYAGLGDTELDAILQFLNKNFSELIVLLGEIAARRDAINTESEHFLRQLSKKIRY